MAWTVADVASKFKIRSSDISSFRELKYSFGEVLKMTGIPFAVLRQWLDKDLLPCLDAERKRDNGKHRRFSPRDIILLSRLYERSRKSTIAILAQKIDAELG